MQRRIIHLGAMLLLLLCIWGHISEIFDRWDNTFKTGSDAEYSTVIVALAMGAVLGMAHAVSTAIIALIHLRSRSSLLAIPLHMGVVRIASIRYSPPPPALRI